MIANPEMQAQIVEYAKQACGLVASFAEQCKADVDQYAPMAFGMILAYMQPLQVGGRCWLASRTKDFCCDGHSVHSFEA